MNQRFNYCEDETIDLLGYDEFVCIDLETTGLTNVYGEIIEIGAVKIKGNEIIDTFTCLIKPKKSKKVPKKITEITGITTEDIENKPYIEKVFPKFLDFIGSRVLIFHNKSFDWDRMLTHYAKESGIVLKNEVIDTIKLAKNTLIDFKGSFKLKSLCDKLNIVNENSHRALSDAIATSKIFIKLKNMNKGKFEDKVYKPIDEKPSLVKIVIKKASYWCLETKTTKRKTKERIYLNLFYNEKFISLYYDIIYDVWNIAPSSVINQNIDFNKVTKALIEFTKINTLEEIINHYRICYENN